MLTGSLTAFSRRAYSSGGRTFIDVTHFLLLLVRLYLGFSSGRSDRAGLACIQIGLATRTNSFSRPVANSPGSRPVLVLMVHDC